MSQLQKFGALSAYDFVFEDELPQKGALLTKISKYWFRKTDHIIDNHMIESDELEQLIPKSHDRCILVKKCKPIRIEAIVRGYISGSAYKQYLESGMISDIEIKGEGAKRVIDLTIKFSEEGKSVIAGLNRLSKPGRRVYSSFNELPRTNGGLGTVVVSTSRGLLSDSEARKRKLGGELICEVWS